MRNIISTRELAGLLASDGLHAVFDVRERGEYNARQIPGATSLPRSQIEFRLQALAPKRKVPIVLYDDDGRRAVLAGRTLAELGYTEVAVLAGGLPAWEKSGGPTASGVNVPSKAFGERVHRERNVPEITPEELKSLRDNAAELTILDVRTPEEYGRFCIPGGLNVPGGDLILWADALKQRPSATIVINCAGRTRSIIGAAALQRLGLANVRALRNGTMGWLLAGLELENKPRRAAPPPPIESAERACDLARRVIREEGIPEISTDQLCALVDETTDAGAAYLIDVRSEGEYENGHLPGSLNLPGGQAVQRADDFIAVRNGTILFISNESARASMAAYWYRQMGFPNVSVLQSGLRGWAAAGQGLARGFSRKEPFGYEAARSEVRFMPPHDLQARIKASAALVLDVGCSLDFEAAHVPGAAWISRGWIELALPEQFPDRRRPIVLTCPDERHSVLAARALAALEYLEVAVLAGGVDAWKAAGYPTEGGLERCLLEPNDAVLSPSIRGSREEMQHYLEWETNLEFRRQ
jgi:rhodanese-related sulfurtransferase